MQRFWTKVDKKPGHGPQGECWIWTASLRSKKTGYGAFKFQGKVIEAHRLAYELQVGPIPEGLCVLHTCDNRICMRDKHLFVGTYLDNNQDMSRKGRCGGVLLRKTRAENEAWCSDCKDFKEKNLFYGNKSRWNGLDPVCKHHSILRHSTGV